LAHASTRYATSPRTTPTAFKAGATEEIVAGPSGTRQWDNPTATVVAASIAINPGTV